MRSITAQMAELESAIGKIDLANRLGCTTNDLQTHPVDCPKEKLGEVIGKGGSNIKSLEKKTGCIIDVDKVKSVVHLRGNLDAIQKGITEIENITLSIEDEVRLTSEVHSFLFGNVSLTLFATLICKVLFHSIPVSPFLFTSDSLFFKSHPYFLNYREWHPTKNCERTTKAYTLTYQEIPNL